MLGGDFENEVLSRSVFELASYPIGYFGKMNSTLRSVVPLAMFSLQISMVERFILVSHHTYSNIILFPPLLFDFFLIPSQGLL